MMRNQTLSGKPTMPSAWSAMVHGKVRPMLADDALWEPAYRSLIAAVLAVWITALLIGLAAWAQVAFPAASQPQADGTTSPARIEAAAGVTGETL